MDKVYCITNKINNKKYVGFTSMTIPERMGQHRHKANNGSKSIIHNAIRKYGWDKFEVSILYEGKDALDREDSYIKRMGDYNIASGGSANQKGRTWKWSEEQKLNVKGKIGVKPGHIPWNKGRTDLVSPKKDKVYVETDNYYTNYMREYRKGLRRRA